jgi:hypothetical protein
MNSNDKEQFEKCKHIFEGIQQLMKDKFEPYLIIREIESTKACDKWMKDFIIHRERFFTKMEKDTPGLKQRLIKPNPIDKDKKLAVEQYARYYKYLDGYVGYEIYKYSPLLTRFNIKVEESLKSIGGLNYYKQTHVWLPRATLMNSVFNSGYILMEIIKKFPKF